MALNSIEKTLRPAPMGMSMMDGPDIEVELLDEDGNAPEATVIDAAPLSHDDNLAELLPDEALTKLAADLEAEILVDIAARADWEKAYKTGIELLGLHLEERTDPWKERHVGAAQDGKTHHVHVFLNRGGSDHLGGLVEPGVDDFHAGIAERGGHDLGTPVVAIEAGLGDEHANGTGHRGQGPSRAVPVDR